MVRADAAVIPTSSPDCNYRTFMKLPIFWTFQCIWHRLLSLFPFSNHHQAWNIFDFNSLVYQVESFVIFHYPVEVSYIIDLSLNRPLLKRFKESMISFLVPGILQNSKILSCLSILSTWSSTWSPTWSPSRSLSWSPGRHVAHQAPQCSISYS